jgi:hydrogenase maturation protease
MTRPRIFIAGIGNIFLGDDAFGSEVARRLQQRELPDDVRVVDFGIRGFDLAYALLEGYEVTILIDATPRGGKPGTLYTIQPDLSRLDEEGSITPLVDAHDLNPMKVLSMVKSLGGNFGRILLLGCEPSPLTSDDGQLGMSEPVEQAVEEAVAVIESLVTNIRAGQARAVAKLRGYNYGKRNDRNIRAGFNS